MRDAYTVRAVKWSGGWELHIDNVGVTQVRTLDKAVDQVRDYLETVHGQEMAHAVVTINPDLNGLESVIAETRQATRKAADAQHAAAEQSREVVRELRSRGLSVTDSAAVLGVSRGRISQLTRATQPATAGTTMPSTAPR